MKREIGLWIDHREAVIVILTNGGEEIRHIDSHSGKHVRYAGSSDSEKGEGQKQITPEDQRDRKFDNVLNKFYDAVIAAVRDADAIKIIGPGEAKGELVKRLEGLGLTACIAGTETVDKMTDKQVAAKVRELFKG